jgi:predicted ATPase/DNA-binding XRE family transcriptional regulator
VQEGDNRGVAGEPTGGFGLLLREFRVAAGLSQEALAQRAGLSVDAVAALERGRRTRPRAFTVGVLADALGLSGSERARLASAAVGPPDATARVLSRAVASETDPADRLPRWLTSFVGRQRELAQLRGHLERYRLVTLLGPGGTGKTRLAVAAALAAPGPRWFVALDACGEPGLVPRAVAAAVGIRDVPGTPLAETLLAETAGLEGLLVLDNCEHVTAAAAELAYGLLRAAPKLRLLATSREVLRVPGEMTWQVPVLPAHDAAQLFTDRAELSCPGFVIGPGNAEAVTRVCQLLDGVPLAIELAAAQSRALTPAQLAEGLDDAFGLLIAGPRCGVPRHRTLRATVDWSYGLLEPVQQRLFDLLSVFRGGFDLTAADAVAGEPVAGLLATLVDRSLVLAEPAGSAMRYRLLEVMRQYGQARLSARDEAGQAQYRHARHYLRLAPRQIPPILWDDPDQRRWLPGIRAERANFDAALQWATVAPAAQAGDTAVELANALAPFWEAEGAINEGQARLEAVLPVARGAHRARVLDLLCRFAFRQADFALAVLRKQESIDIKQAEGDEQGMAYRLSELGLYRICQDDIATGQALLHRALKIMSRHGFQHGVAAASAYLGLAELLNGEPGAAADRFAVTAAIWDAGGDQPRLTITRWLQSLALLDAGDLPGARTLTAEMLRNVAGQFHGMPEDTGWVWSAMVLAEASQQDHTALRLLGAIGAWRRRGHQWPPPMRRRYQPAADRLLKRTDPTVAAALMAEGAAMSPTDLAVMAYQHISA